MYIGLITIFFSFISDENDNLAEEAEVELEQNEEVHCRFMHCRQKKKRMKEKLKENEKKNSGQIYIKKGKLSR